jgi:hypothetical protein
MLRVGVVQNFDGVAVEDRDDGAGEVSKCCVRGQEKNNAPHYHDETLAPMHEIWAEIVCRTLLISPSMSPTTWPMNSPAGHYVETFRRCPAAG